ncbi:MAG: hypothetical protein Q7T50_08930, partial [Candidatus Magasanikbacteria bacterium]|nr:hypothetical protein [Candidatus Magasanikbacteria bacterium]
MKERLDLKHETGDVILEVTLFYESGYSIDETVTCLYDAIDTNIIFFKGCNNFPTELTVTLLTHRSEYDEVLGWKSSVWGSGITRGNHIYTFHPDRRAIETSHSRETFRNTLTHEICHVFSSNIFGKELWWAREGVAQYVAKQNVLKPIEENNIEHFITNSLHQNIRYSDFVNNYQGHQISRRIGYVIGEKYGQETLRSFLGVSPNDASARIKIAKLFNIS